MGFRHITFVPQSTLQPHGSTWNEPVAPMGDLENFIFSDDTGDWIPSEEENFFRAAYRPPPPGWADALREIRSSIPPRQEDPNVVYRPG